MIPAMRSSARGPGCSPTWSIRSARQRAIRFQLMAERLGEEYAAELRHQVPMLVAASGGWAQVEHLAEPMQLGVEGESPSVVLTALASPYAPLRSETL